MRLCVATKNRGKVAELRRLLAGLDGLELVGLDAFDPVPDVEEDEDTFEGNAVKKARELCAATGLPTLADDSGLEVDALGGAPGIHSARYAGEPSDDAANNEKLLRALSAVPTEGRTARFRCALALVDPSGPLGDAAHVEHGVVEGRIVEVPRGEGGFGYDPLFVPLGDTRTTAELPPEEKNEISHRAEAARKMKTFLEGYLRRRG